MGFSSVQQTSLKVGNIHVNHFYISNDKIFTKIKQGVNSSQKLT